ncbi:MAG: family oxidoreductase [Fibrobacteres bacterium]|nr:family oxidoreductase [Fibrobacterota bacterium]
MRRVECDILIIGSGAAGGVLAATLAEATGKRIVLVEKGGHFGKEFFTQREWDANALYAGSGARATSDGSIPVRGGECVGGGTTVNIALCFDPVRDVWEGWKKDFGVKGFSFQPGTDDYGVKDLNMADCLAQVRGRINVHTPPDDQVNGNNRVLETGCRAMGFSSKHFELNMRECRQCGFCAQGCAYDSKQGTAVTFIPDALAKGVTLVHHCDIERLEWNKTQGGMVVKGAVGTVRATTPGSRPNAMPPGPIQFAGKLVILCCGAVESPSLLMRSGHPDPFGTLGRGLILHPSLPIVGVLDHEIGNYRGISGTIYSDHFHRSHGFYLECLFSHPVYGSVLLPGFGGEHFELLLKYRSLAGFGAMLIDEVDPENRVVWDAAKGKASIRYRLTEGDKRRMRFAAKTGVETMFAGGAREVLLPSEERLGPLPYPRFRSREEAVHCSELLFTPHQTTVTSAHCQATVKMGEDPGRSMVNSRGESHFMRNLMVCDSSVFPTSCGANPMLSILTMARYQGRRVAAELARYGL